MIAEISSLVASSKAAYDIAKGINSLKSEIDRNESVSKVLEVLLAVQTQALSVNAIAQKLQEEKYELTKKVMEFEKWSETISQYELKEIAPGVLVYAYKKSDNSKEPMHWLCPNCFDTKRQKSIFQRMAQDGRGTHYACHGCGNKICDHSKPLSESIGRMVFSNGVV